MRHVILMGVAGSGKTTLGLNLARQLGWLFVDADDYHPPDNIAKMRAGEPLSDADRAPWLKRLQELLYYHQDGPLILACSALKARYRQLLTQGLQEPPHWFWLHGAPELLLQRLSSREGHFAGPELLASQLDSLEPPAEACRIPLEWEPQAQLAAVLEQLLDPSEPSEPKSNRASVSS